MLLGHIDHPDTYTPFLTHPTWEKVMTWLKGPLDQAEGEYEIQGKDIYASITTISTVPRNEGIFEAHQNYIDVHLCLAGSERIEWLPTPLLQPKTEYDATKDFTLFHSPPHATSFHLTPGTFAIFFPDDAHMPKLSDGDNTQVKKVVVKININLFK